MSWQLCFVFGLIQSWEPVGPLDRRFLHSGGNTDGGGSEEECNEVHLPGERSGEEDLVETGVANNEELHVELCKPDNQEPPVAVNALEAVEFNLVFGVKLSAVEHVEESHHHEGLEHQGVVLHAVGWDSLSVNFVVEGLVQQVVLDSEHGWSSEEHDKHHEGLVEELTCNSSPHERSEDLVTLLDALSSEFFWMWCFGAEGNSGSYVHDDVDPEELDDGEG